MVLHREGPTARDPRRRNPRGEHQLPLGARDSSLKSTSNRPQPSLLVRAGIVYFRRLSAGARRIEIGDGVHYLNPDERIALRRIERNAIIRAALAGALSTAAAGVAEVLAHPLLGPHPDHATWEQSARFWAVVVGATIVASIIEIAYLYWDGLRAVHLLSREAGLDLFPDEDDDKALAGAMARAALELPTPPNGFFGVNPFREASRARLVISSLVYKLKVSVTNFLVKALVRRMLGRAFVRVWLPFVAVPITAAWNAAVCWQILREARIRAMGPSAAREMIDIVFANVRSDETTLAGRVAVVRAVASSIVRTEDMHPNLVALLEEVARRTGVAPHTADSASGDLADLDDSKAFLAQLPTLDPGERRLTLRVLAIASIIDGRLTRAEKRLLVEAHAASGVPLDLAKVHALRRAFLGGDAIDRARIEAL
jgi:hypothetical protein